MPKGQNTIQTKRVWIEDGEFQSEYLGLNPTKKIQFRTKKDIDNLIIALKELDEKTYLTVANTIVPATKTKWDNLNEK